MNPEYLGMLAAFCTTASFMPQALKTLRTRDMDSLSPWMYLLLNLGLALWLIYGILITKWPVIIANAVSLIPNLIILGLLLRQKMQSKRRKS